jgi:proteic killer suppression protein
MQLWISNKKLKRAIEDDGECRKRFGAEMAKKVKLRIDALCAAESLADFWPPYSGPERCHELKGAQAGTFSVDVKHPYRLLFQPADAARETEEEGEKQQWLAIRSIEILGIEDTHG